MKFCCCFIWMLITMVVAATADRIPDPPARNPEVAQFRVSCPHELPPDLQKSALILVPSRVQPEHSAAVCDSSPLPPVSLIVPVERGADPSPPLLQ